MTLHDLAIVAGATLVLAVNSLPADEANPVHGSVLAAPEMSLEEGNHRGAGGNIFGGVQDLSFSAVAGPGFVAFGSKQAHDVAWGTFGYGHLLWRPLGKGHWYAGQFEGRVEVFAGAQFSPNSEWIFGLTPHLRYNFNTGTRFVPFLDGGAGVTATGIGPPDLSNTFEFNLQIGPGVHYFLKDNLALTLEARFLHMSCAGISSPNLGLNAVLGSVGVTVFF